MAARGRFRPLAERDLPTVVEWFADPEIARWWKQTATLESVRAKYVPRIEHREPTRMWIAEIDGAEGGLLQSYLHVDYPEHDERVGIAGAVGIDYLIASSHRKRGTGRLVLRQFAEWILALHPDATCCVATPAQGMWCRGAPSNTRASPGSASVGHPTSPSSTCTPFRG